MNTLLFQKLMDFMVTQANHAAHAPLTQQGVQVILDGRKLTFIAVDFGETTIIESQDQSVSGGKGEFFLPFDEILNLNPPLRYENSEPQDGSGEVVLTRTTQPLVPSMVALKISIGSWFESYLGVYKPAGLPKRSAVHRHEVITYLEVKHAAKSLRALSKNSHFAWQREKENRYKISLESPIAGLKSVTKIIY